MSKAEELAALNERLVSEAERHGQPPDGTIYALAESAEELRRLKEDLAEARAQRQAAFRTIEHLQDQLSAERMRIKDGIIALAMTAERCEDDGPEVQTAIKAFAFRVSLMIDGHDDLVMNDAAKSFLGWLLETRVYQSHSFKEDELKEMERYIEKITKDPKAAREFLIRAEIIDENGDLARHYRQPEDES